MRLINKGQIDTLTAQKEFAEDRAKQTGEQSASVAGTVEKSVSEMRIQLADLRTAVAGHALANKINPIIERLASGTATVASSNTVTQQIARVLLDPADWSATTRTEIFKKKDSDHS
jgi:hypothetical protein